MKELMIKSCQEFYVHDELICDISVLRFNIEYLRSQILNDSMEQSIHKNGPFQQFDNLHISGTW